ncbi:ABC transporter ATP-binding protein [Parageobacillus thermoglucosidasius]|uniref:ABC transporter ATP-binding protein n=1 Tax=Parageobacillus thermoglucosidasius TaxID=1426 RepID=UPI000B564312|nr:ABC transporter ATP-binding protein [Parageobacillus thermoglucosidasius]MBY6268607.1 ABC transporter ATP-binding protein [Parageobacillus thermoglucosidasius]OUM88943.1 MAG: nitrate ABC transporter ATP-binding protein [Parageobacillus thermoglucosidasius]
MSEVVAVQQPIDHAEYVKKKIEVKSLYFSYEGAEILKNIHLDVKEGEFLVLMGPSGCGKSTFLRLIAGLEQPDKGEIIVNGVPTTQKLPDCGVVFQDYSLFPWLSAEENIILALKQKLKKTKKELKHIAREYLGLVQLSHATKKYPGQMSGGMKQRAAIARALAFGSDLMLMDEPFGALDPLTRIHLQDLLLQISRDHNRTIVFVTHDADEAIYLADRIVIFSLGSSAKGAVTTSVDVPFKKPRNRKTLFSSSEFMESREHVLTIMNQGLLDNLEEQHAVGSDGDGI